MATAAVGVILPRVQMHVLPSRNSQRTVQYRLRSLAPRQRQRNFEEPSRE